MAIVYARLNRLRERAGRDDSGIKISQPWEVWATFGSTGLDAMLHTDVPQYGEAYSDGGLTDLRVRSQSVDGMEIVQDKAPNGSSSDLKFDIMVEFGVPDWRNSDPNPLDRRPDIRVVGGDLTEAMLKDWADLAVVNSVGDLYDPLPERPIQCADVVVTHNEAGNPLEKAAIYSRSVNSQPWYSAAGYAAFMGKIEGSFATEIVNGTNFEYWRVSYPISLRTDGWKLKLIDNGVRFKSGSDKFSIKGKDGRPVTSPQLLNGAGDVASGTPPTPVVYPTAGYDQFKPLSWATLGCPDPFQ